MPTIREYAISSAASGACSTEGVRGLSNQIFSLLLPVVASEMGSCEDFVRIGGGSTIPYLQTPARDALRRAVEEKGEEPTLLHAYRTVAQQYVLYYWFQNGRCRITLAAEPGSSPHEKGVAIDISQNAQWRRVLSRHNWMWRGRSDPGHFTYVGAGISTRIKTEGIRAFQRLWNRNNPNDQVSEDGVYGERETGPRLLRSPVGGW